MMKAICIFAVLACTLVRGQEVQDVPCPEPTCTREYRPQCVTFAKTFDDPCVAGVAGCELAKAGFFLDDWKPTACSCDFGCTQELDLVCGSNNQTYNNMCDINKAACQGEKIFMVSEGACP